MTAYHLGLLLVLGGAGAAVGRALHVPMWPLTGAILGASTVHLFGFRPLDAPGWLAVVGQLLVGCAVGSSVGRNLFGAIRRVSRPGAVVVAAIIGVGVLVGLVLAVTGRADPVPALLGSVPGGVGEMVAAAAGLGADSALVAGMHLVRLFAVLLTLPLLLRWARRWRP
jgi:uncharacterized protein